MNNEPVAWYKKNSNDYLIENIGQPSFQVQEFIDAGYIPVYTHLVDLTDEELDSIIASVPYPRTHAMDKHMIKLALKKASEK